MSKGVLVLFTLGLATLAAAYKSGAPPEVCQDMMPQHGLPGQTTPFPYSVRLHKNRIRSGDSVDLTISGKNGLKFKGFLIQARVGDTPVGQFVPKGNNAKAIDCGTGTKNAATHSDASEKSQVVLTWVPPRDLKETVTFYVTVAKNGGEYWVAQKTRTLTVQ